MTWAVFARVHGRGSLSGEYAGATAEATFAVGLGANALVGGSNRSIALQPLSVTGQTGFNAAGGVAVGSHRFGKSPHETPRPPHRRPLHLIPPPPLASPALT